MKLSLINTVDHYADPEIGDLQNAIADGAGLQTFLAGELPERSRFQSKLLSNPTAYDVHAALNVAKKELLEAEKRGERNTFLFFFAGHGIGDLLLCTDAYGVADGSDKAIGGKIDPDTMSAFKAGLTQTDFVFWLDACRTKIGRAGEGEAVDLSGYRDPAYDPSACAVETGRSLIFATCEDGKPASDDGLAMRLALDLMRESLREGREIVLDSNFAEALGQRLAAARPGRRQHPTVDGRPVSLASGAATADKGAAPTPEPVKSKPRRPAIVPIREFEIGTIEIEEPSAIFLPTVPFEIADAQARLKWLDAQIASREATISALRSASHPALVDAKRQTLAAKAQYDDLKSECELRSTDFWTAFEKNPEVSPLDLDEFMPNGWALDEFARQVELARNALRAKAAFERAQNQYKAKVTAKCDELKAKAAALKTERDRLAADVAEPIDRFFAVVALKILESTKGFDNVDALPPYSEFNKLDVLTEYGLGWNDKKKNWRRTENVWKTKRPCVLKALELGSWGDSATREAGYKKELTLAGILTAFHWCPSGEFMMGSPESEAGRFDNEVQHKVRLTHGFWMQETEVTQELWRAVMGGNPSCFKGDKLPVEEVSWEDVEEFIRKLNGLNLLPSGVKFSLPTEAQWEYACRAGSTGPYNGSDLDTLGWYRGNSGDKTHPVHEKDANAWGLYDMHGNVWEHCQDWWYEAYPTGAVEDPTGPSYGSSRVGRGGGWLGDAGRCRSASRGCGAPSGRLEIQGFRLSLVCLVR